MIGQHNDSDSPREMRTTTNMVLIVPELGESSSAPFLKLQIVTDAAVSPALIPAIREAVLTDKPVTCPSP